MTIEDDEIFDIEVYQVMYITDVTYIEQGDDQIAISKKQAANLIEVLTNWVNGEEIE